MRSLLVSLMLILSARAAWADVALVRAIPEPDSEATTNQVELVFNEALRSDGSAIIVLDPGDEPIDGINVFAGKTLYFRWDLPPSPGDYEVRWHATSVSGQRIEGGYRFSNVPVF